MVLYKAIDIKIGNGANEVVEVRHGTNVVWTGEGDPGEIWTFEDPAAGDTIKLTAQFFGRSTIHWGDGNSEDLPKNSLITHTYQ